MTRTRTPIDKIKIHVYLRRPDARGYKEARIIAYFHNTDFCVSPGVRILPEQVDKKGRPEQLYDPGTQRVTSNHPNATRINSALQLWFDRIEAAFRKLSGPHGYTRVTKPMMEAELFPPSADAPAPAPAAKAATKKPAAPSTGVTWRELLEQWKHLNRHLAPDSLRKYDQLATMMESWRPELRPAALDEETAAEYRNHLLDQKLSDAAIKVHFTGIRKCFERLGLPTDAPWLQYSAQNAPQLDLEIDELRRLIRWRPTTAQLAEERDRWLFQLFSGRRYEDLEKLEHARQRTVLTLDDGRQVPALLHTQGKTGLDAAVPLPPIAVRIGERWQWQFPARGHQDRNEWIKQVAKEAGLTREWDDRKISGGKVHHNWRPVWQVIGTHTARHTAGTLLKQVSGNKALAKLVLGHADEDVTDRYAKDKARLLAPQVLEAWQQILGDWYDANPA
ncbi:hypothetical protein LJ737_04130 [Hymenobacter sp. 15J16-1T3B]|uniref:tyrosine-type recombinase/integrase n=1 Tax=Hymenobacter sp. 15J16-1T3B TaxID=2886941 RepID=UPI001D128276|nr:hypothetical protein [Hymenobacter sp. 15J16-1T3B]MCC3156410.1 hypothetical protein [Hymenobacter sp. 15J16-1T3B]